MPRGGHFKGTAACLSALFTAGRHDDLLDLLGMAPHKFWHDRLWGVRALVAQGKTTTAIRYAEDTRGLNQPDGQISAACEAILLSEGRWREAYDRYAVAANRHGTYQATFKALKAKYPQVEPKAILADLIARTPGETGKWFAAAKSAGLLDEAAELARTSPCDPKTLTRAARDFAASNPEFARAVGLAALQWILRGHGYDLTSQDVGDALRFTLAAARHHDTEADTVRGIEWLVVQHPTADRTVVAWLRRSLDDATRR